ncbi:MAG: hypothetical protein BWY26_00765 [Elusimicrobia bacterium ADurb.Bin231]|nr:MAG: hypothetical protein BWY26_00765 [Elusimicrobia bacterium ADurb.Bin231]
MFIWQFCLWRLQAIFEGMRIHNLFLEKQTKPLFGLKAKLDALINAGFAVSENDIKDLLDWSILRNLLSHAPHGHFSLSSIEESDIIEYKDLLLRIYMDLNCQNL